MRKFFFRSIAIATVFFASVVLVAAQQPPRVFLFDAKTLVETKQKLSDGKKADPALRSALEKLERDAQRALKTEFLSIVTKTALPPSGDKHDYMSQSPYFWKNPKTANGFPYIKKDGERNPEINTFPDSALMGKMRRAVEDLAGAFYFTGKEEYAAKATAILRMWFLDPETKMNPNLNFAQAIPGQTSGRGFGIIETREWSRLVDSIGMLSGSSSWTKADQAGIELWFSAYLDWLLTSVNGIDESKTKNNHATHYDGQVVSFALFVGRKKLAKSVLESVKKNRIATQIEPDGRQPHELARTRSWSYSTMNLGGLVTLAELGETVGIDLWHFQTADGRSIRKAIEYLFPFAINEKKWGFQQIIAFEPERLYVSMRQANSKFNDAQFRRMMATVPKPEIGDRYYLFGK